ncbi:MAG: DUF4136 domain-containing protein [Gammaproteobacteria bacterium]|nr:DUF4136 domain-containing protein [Gammaproteobacteria bacterium]MDP6616164.1 DUF4136 domain-containing protein [Gammaproteobacteria bacterium]MDP6695628.1 DUF4136 domain-containing protein [Gammaproteobacteria bacterium]
MNTETFRLTARILVIAGALAVCACATGPKIFSNESPNADFRAYKTYNYQVPLDTDRKDGTRSILSNHLINAVDREMRARGYTRIDNPDLEIQFSLNTKEKITSRSSGPSVAGGYYGYRGRYGYGTTIVYSDPQIRQYTEGTLNIDLVDNEQNELAWEGIAIGKIRDEDRANIEVAVNRVVAEIFLRYPYYAPGFVPPPPPPAE